ATEGVMAAASIRSDGEEHVAFARHQLGAGREIDRALRLDSTLRGVPIAHVMRVVEECVGSLVALEIDNSERLAALDLVHPAISRREGEVIDSISRSQQAFGVDQSAHAK